MTRPVSALPNLGPQSEAALARVGIMSAEALIAMGADTAYARLLENGARPHFIGYYVLVLAIQGRPWTDIDREEKAALRIRFDALKAGVTPRVAPLAALEAELDRLGVVAGPEPEMPGRRAGRRQPTSSRPEKK
jgi:hypothetical protein